MRRLAIAALVICAGLASAGRSIAQTVYQAPQSIDLSSAWNGTYLVDVRDFTYDIWNTQTSTSLVFNRDLHDPAGIMCKPGNPLTLPVPDVCSSNWQNYSLFDARVKYDVVNNRWIITVGLYSGTVNIPNPYTNSFFLAASMTSDPTGNWYVYQVPDCGGDQPELGLTPNYISVMGNFCPS